MRVALPDVEAPHKSAMVADATETRPPQTLSQTWKSKKSFTCLIRILLRPVKLFLMQHAA